MFPSGPLAWGPSLSFRSRCYSSSFDLSLVCFRCRVCSNLKVAAAPNWKIERLATTQVNPTFYRLSCQLWFIVCQLSYKDIILRTRLEFTFPCWMVSEKIFRGRGEREERANSFHQRTSINHFHLFCNVSIIALQCLVNLSIILYLSLCHFSPISPFLILVFVYICICTFPLNMTFQTSSWHLVSPRTKMLKY